MDLKLALLNPEIKPREYQFLAAASALKHNTLVVMPTALGKTYVALMLAAHYLEEQPEKKILFLAPTKPLVEQQASRFREALGLKSEAIVSVTGSVSPAKRTEMYSSAKIIVGTPQTCEHDVLTRKLELKNFSLVVFDEAHRAVGDYAYVFLGEQAKANNLRILGLTASPSSQKEKIEEICSNIGIQHIELRHEKDPLVEQHVQKVRLSWIFVDLPPEFLSLQKILREMLSEVLMALKEGNFIHTADLSKVNKKDLLQARGALASSIRNNPAGYQGMSLIAKAMNLNHALELLEAQGIQALVSFLHGMKERPQKTKAVQQVLADFRTTKMLAIADELLSKGIVHPKIERLKTIVGDEVSHGKSLIVFAHFKDTVASLVERLNMIPNVTAKALVGRSGMTQKKQKELLDEFGAKEFNVLVCTSVGEEGLDIAAVDTVIFYEAVPSEIRSIQRRGRAGRIRAGNAIVLLAKNTKDEAFFWIAKRKEKAMHAMIEDYSRSMSEARKENNKPEGEGKQTTLS